MLGDATEWGTPDPAPARPVQPGTKVQTEPQTEAAKENTAPASAHPADSSDVTPPPSFGNDAVGQETHPEPEGGNAAPFYGDDMPYSEAAPTGDPFAHEPPFKPRRNPVKLWTRAAIGFALVAVVLVGAIYTYGLPQWLVFGDPAMGEEVVGLEIMLPIDEDDRRTLPDGTELFAASGSVVNNGAERRDVPDMLIVLRNADDRIVYEQEIRAPVASLGPGEEARFDEALLDIPRSAVRAEIGWAPGRL